MKNHYFFSQPHQPFFVLGFINAIISIVLFIFAYKGTLILTITPQFFHAYSLIFLLFTPAFIAFLFTTFPRFLSTKPIEKNIYLGVLIFFLSGNLFYITGAIFSFNLALAGMGLLFVGNLWAIQILWNIYKTSPIPDKYDQKWILSAMIAGIIAHVLFITSHLLPQFISIAINIAIYLYLFMVAISVAQRMMPFFFNRPIEKNKSFLPTIFALTILHTALEIFFSNTSFIADIILAYITAKEILRWRLPFLSSYPLMWILYVSLYWVPVAFFFGAISKLITLLKGTNFLFLDIHILMLGFVFTILIGFGTRVTLGHSGNRMEATLWEKILFIWTQIVVITRLLTSMVASFGWDFMPLFDISVVAWLLMFIPWAFRFFGVLIYGKKLT